MLDKIKIQYNRFPSKFWVLVGTVFIDMIGGTLLWPFFALYITQKFQVGMTEAGLILGASSLSGLFGSTVGGALTDRFGRKSIILGGLIFSAVSALALGVINALNLMLVFAIITGFFGSIAGPAHNAMVADLLPEEKRNEGFGIIRVVANLSWIIGPSIGGFLASRSYLALFIIDAVFSLITAAIFFKLIPETKPEHKADSQHESLGKTILGYRFVFKDLAFIGFLAVSVIMLLVYQQMYNTLSVYLRDFHQIPTQQYGMLMSASAVLVVLTQIWITKQTRKYPPLTMMALGALFYAIGFSSFGFFSAYLIFVLAILIITVGEMITVPVSQALAAKFAPEDMRGRYMAVFGLSWSIPQTIGPVAAGLILDNSDPRLLWYIGGVLCLVSVLGYMMLHNRLKHQERFAAPSGMETGDLAVPET